MHPKAKVGTFVLIMDFLNHKWKPCHLTIGLFEMTNNFWVYHAYVGE